MCECETQIIKQLIQIYNIFNTLSKMGNACGCGGDSQPKNIDEYIKSKFGFL